ncbi:MAG: diguanylate cyclase domain-containing protein [Thermodesulfobacteriota bacterium]
MPSLLPGGRTPATGITDKAGQIAESLRLEVLESKIPHAYSRCSKYLTISLGVAAAIPDTGYSIQNLLGKADQAMYNAKHQGRNRVYIMPDGD